MRRLAAALAAVALLTTGTAVAASTTHQLRAGIAWQRSQTWHWQDTAGVSRTRTAYMERHVTSPAFLRWDAQLWNRRRLAARRHALAHPALAHYQLWMCIHHGEGSWYDADSGGNGHYGGLQMTSPWGAGVYYVSRADYLTPYQQMRKAELGYRASGYSERWLLGQWYHPECLSYR